MTSYRAAISRPSRAPCAATGFIIYLTFIAAFTLLAASTPVSAQEGAASADDIVRIRTDLVTVPVLVTDSRGRRVSGLVQGDFAVRDEGRPAELAYFAAGADRVALTFVLDASGSARDIATQQRETALALVSRFGRASRVAVLPFGARPASATAFTTDIDKVRAAFHYPAPAGQRTAIFDAALAAISGYETAAGDVIERRLIILISDGLDTASTTRAVDVINEARRRDVSIYVIHLPIFAPRDGRLVPRSPTKGFKELAEQTGGQYFMVGDAESALDPRAEYNLAPVFRAIAEDLQAQYVLGYYLDDTAERDKPRRRIEVGLTSRAKRKLHVRKLREGYRLNNPPPVPGK